MWHRMLEVMFHVDIVCSENSGGDVTGIGQGRGR